MRTHSAWREAWYRHTRRAWSWLGLNLGKRAGTVAVVGVALTLALGLGMTKLRFVTSNASYLNATDQSQLENEAYQRLFGGDPIVTMWAMRPGTTVDQLFTPANVAEMERVEHQLARDRDVFSVVGPNDAVALANTLVTPFDDQPTHSLAAALLLSAYQRAPATDQAARFSAMAAELAAFERFTPAQRVLANPQWVHFLIHDDSGHIRTSLLTFLPNDTHAEMIVALRGDLTIDQEAAAARRVLRIVDTAHYENATTVTTGVPDLLNTINQYLKHGMLTLTLIAAAVMVAILLLAFNVRWRLLAFGVVAIGLTWAFGLVGYLGIPLSLGSIAALPTLLGVGIDYAIQMHSRVEEEVILDRAAHPIQATARNLGPALLVVTFDAVFAFAALWFAKVPMIRDFGSLLVVGIVAVCVFSIVGPLAFLGIREFKSPTAGTDFRTGRLSRLVVWLGKLPAPAAVPLAACSVAVFLAGIAVEGHLTMQTDPIQWVNPASPAIEHIQALKNGTGADNELGIQVGTTDPWSNTTVDYVARLADAEETRYPATLFPPTGLVSMLEQLTDVPGTSPVPPLGAMVHLVYMIAPPPIQHLVLATKGTTTYFNIVYRGHSAVLSQLAPVVTQLQHGVPRPPGMTVAPGGIAVVGVGLLDNLARSRTLLTYLAIVMVGTFLAIRLRSVVRSLLSLVPVLIAVGAVSVVADLFGVKLSPMTSVAGPLVVAACTEFTSLILLRFVEERGRGLAPRQAVDVTASRTGRAFMVSAMTAVAGIGVMATSSMPLLRGFGIVVAMNVAVALVCALVVLPPVLVWADADPRQWVSRNFARPAEEPTPPEGRGTPPPAMAAHAGTPPPAHVATPAASVRVAPASWDGAAAEDAVPVVAGRWSPSRPLPAPPVPSASPSSAPVLASPTLDGPTPYAHPPAAGTTGPATDAHRLAPTVVPPVPSVPAPASRTDVPAPPPRRWPVPPPPPAPAPRRANQVPVPPPAPGNGAPPGHDDGPGRTPIHHRGQSGPPGADAAEGG